MQMAGKSTPKKKKKHTHTHTLFGWNILISVFFTKSNQAGRHIFDRTKEIIVSLEIKNKKYKHKHKHKYNNLKYKIEREKENEI